ncbi:MAG: type II toxin-antitoxin system PemK/MazF family toxin [Planctomycetota bacterium]
MPSTTTYRRGEVVVVSVPFSNQAGSKPRPALVLSADSFHRGLPDVLVCAISSQPRYHQRPGPGDVPLSHWQAGGLHHPSTVRLSNLFSVEKTLIRYSLGTLHPADWARVETGLRKAFGL